MHPILDLQHVVFYATLEEPLEHAPTVSRLITVLAENSCWQLSLVTHKDDFLWFVLEGDQIRKLNRLTCLVDNQVLKVTEGEVVEHLRSRH